MEQSNSLTRRQQVNIGALRLLIAHCVPDARSRLDDGRFSSPPSADDFRLLLRDQWQDTAWIDTLETHSEGFYSVRIVHKM